MTLRLRLLGGFEARLDDGPPLIFARKKSHALLAYLALSADRRHPRDKLVTLLWSDAAPDAGRRNLRQALHAVRRALGAHASILAGDVDAISLTGDSVEVDVAEFARLAATGEPDALTRAVDLYRGDLLAGLGPQSAAFEEWLLAERVRLHELAIEALARLLGHQTKHDLIEEAMRTAMRLLAIDPLQEPVHRILMRLHVRRGGRAAALRQYQACVDALRRELGAEPEPETRALYLEIVRSPKAPNTAGAGDAAELLPPLVGREVELAVLHDALEDASARRGRLVSVLGEAGVGKTRLVQALVVEAARRGVRVLIAQGHETEHIVAFGPWVEALRASGVLNETMLVDTLGPACRADLSRLFPELSWPAPATIAGAHDPGRIFTAVAELLRLMAAREPLLVALEDLHWADDMTLRLVAFIARRLASVPLLLVITAREGEFGPTSSVHVVLDELDRERLERRIVLLPLSRDATLELVHRVARAGMDAATATSLGEHVWRISEGNPFVAVETVRAMDEGAVAPVADALPRRVHDLVSGRLVRVTKNARTLVAVAATVGRAFEFSLVQRASALDEVSAAGALEELVRRRILHGEGERFEFRHVWIREVAYAALLSPQRRVLHRAIAESLEVLYRERLEPYHADLVAHWRESEEWAKAIAYLERVAEQAARSCAPDEALAALNQARALAERLSEPLRDRHLVELGVRRAHVQYFLGRMTEALHTLDEARACVARVADPAVAAPYHAMLGRVHVVSGNYELAMEHARQALTDARPRGDRLTMGQACLVLALVTYWTGSLPDAAAHAREAIALLDRDTEWHGWATWRLSCTLTLIGDFDGALETNAETMTTGDALGDWRLRCSAAWVHGWIQAARGEDGRDACLQALALAPDPVSTANAEAALGYAVLERGDASEAARRLDAAVARIARMRVQPSVALFLAMLGEAHRASGAVENARDAALRAERIAQEMNYPFALAWAHRVLGRLARDAGDRVESRSRLERARATFASIGARVEADRSRLDLDTV